MTTHHRPESLPDNDSKDHCKVCVRMKNGGTYEIFSHRYRLFYCLLNSLYSSSANTAMIAWYLFLFLKSSVKASVCST